MKLTFLGTGAGVPSRRRNVSSMALQWMHTGSLWLFDCGEGTQHQVLRSPLSLRRLENIFLSHLHGDHLFGLAGLLASRSLQGGSSLVRIFGPDGIAAYVRSFLEYSRMQLSYPIQVITVSPGIVYEDESVSVRCAFLCHTMPNAGYRVQEKERPGPFLVDRAKAFGIPPGPVYAALKRGERVRLENGQWVEGKDFLGPKVPGRSLVVTGDTQYCRETLTLAEGADVLVHEATFAHADRHLAEKSSHSTAVQAAEAARVAGVGRLILTHISPRYQEGDGAARLLAEARKVFPPTDLAEDFSVFEIPRRGGAGRGIRPGS
jgi:ribonuclease Z